MHRPSQILNLRRSSWHRVVGILIVLVLASCAVDSGDDNEEENDYTEQETVFDVSGITDADGSATVSFNVAEGTTKFSITARIDDAQNIRFTELRSADGVDYLSPDGLEISYAGTFFPWVNAASIPSRSADPAVDDAQRFVATAEAVEDPNSRRSAAEGQTIVFTVNSKADRSLSSGQLLVNVFYVGEVGEDQTTRDVIGTALNNMRSLFSNGAHITLSISEHDIEGPVLLPSPLEGSEFYLANTGSVISPALNIFIGGDIEGLSEEQGAETLGLSAGIPGPPIPSQRSAVAISIFAGAGPDGIYSSEDVRILGETIAHESGHYLGLFHPVDFGGNTVVANDPLGDTTTCSFITECVGDIELIDNLMFPSPVPDGEGGYRPQYIITAEQRDVLNRYIVVD